MKMKRLFTLVLSLMMILERIPVELRRMAMKLLLRKRLWKI